MKVLSHYTGRVLQFVNLDEIAPIDGAVWPQVINVLGLKYSFRASPTGSTPWAQILSDGVKFEEGLFKSGERVDPIKDIVIYHNGLMVTATTTEIAEAVMQEVFTMAAESLGFRISAKAMQKRIYLSELSVQFDVPASSILKQSSAVLNLVTEALRETYKAGLPPTDLLTLKIHFDKAIAPRDYDLLGQFSLEKRALHPFTDNVYLAQAPLRTQDFEKVLEGLETIMRC